MTVAVVARRSSADGTGGAARARARISRSQEMVSSYMDRLISASSQKSRAWSEIAKRYQTFNRPDLARLVVERAGLILAVNMHPTASAPDWRVGIPRGADQAGVLNTDEPEYGGHSLIAAGQRYPWQPVEWDTHGQSVQIYVPARSALVIGVV